MGLLDGQRVTTVSTSSSRLIDDAYIPDELQKAVFSAVMNNTSVGDSINNAIINGTASSFDSYYNYGKKHYAYGLPSVSLNKVSDIFQELKWYIETSQGVEITLEYAHYTDLDPLQYAWTQLQDSHGFERINRTITNVPGVPVTLVNLTNITITTTTDGFESFAPDASLTEPIHYIVGGVKSADIQYSYEHNVGTEEEPDIQTVTGSFLIVQPDTDKHFFQAYYHYVDPVTYAYVYRYFTHDNELSAIVDVASTYEANTVNVGTYYPYIMLRSGSKNLGSSEYLETDEYLTSVKLVKRIGLDYQVLLDEVSKANDIDKVEQCVVQNIVPLYTDNVLDLKYIHDFIIFLSGIASQYPEGASEFLLRYQEGADYDGLLEFFKAWTFTYEGTVGDGTVGNIDASLDVDGDWNSDWIEGGVYTTLKDNSPHVDDKALGLKLTPGYQGIATRKQLEDGIVEVTSATYLGWGQRIYGDHTDTHYPRTLSNTEQLAKPMVPVVREIIRSYTYWERSELLLRSLYIVANARETIQLDWYETEQFQMILIVATAILTITTGNAMIASLSMAINAGTMAVIMVIIEMIIKYYLFKFAVEITVDELGEEWAMIIAVIAAAVSVSGYEYSPIGLDSQTLLTISNGISMGMNVLAQEKMSDLQHDAEDFEEYRQDKQDELEAIEELINSDGLLDVDEFIHRDVTLADSDSSPSEYFYQAIHAGNIGTLVLDYPHTYHDIQLTLPGK